LIVVDTSVLVAILKDEPDAKRLWSAMAADSDLRIGAPTKFELLLVMGRWRAEPAIETARDLVKSLGIVVVDWTDVLTDAATDTFLRYGKGRHEAALNFNDCMSYALAKSLDAPLLYKGDDFAKTDIRSALP
jgi:ribonuclease VapC